MVTLLKILLVPAISIAVFVLPWQVALALSLVQIILSFCFHITLRDQLMYLRAILYYAVLILIVNLLTKAPLVPTLIMLLKLSCVMQTAALVFNTSTPLQIRQALKKAPFSQALTLFICFIPQVSKNWEQIKKAWFARGGKRSPRMLLVLLPVLFSVGMKQAWNTARALCARGYAK